VTRGTRLELSIYLLTLANVGVEGLTGLSEIGSFSPIEIAALRLELSARAALTL
jgi:hypothetical protein